MMMVGITKRDDHPYDYRLNQQWPVRARLKPERLAFHEGSFALIEKIDVPVPCVEPQHRCRCGYYDDYVFLDLGRWVFAIAKPQDLIFRVPAMSKVVR